MIYFLVYVVVAVMLAVIIRLRPLAINRCLLPMFVIGTFSSSDSPKKDNRPDAYTVICWPTCVIVSLLGSLICLLIALVVFLFDGIEKFIHPFKGTIVTTLPAASNFHSVDIEKTGVFYFDKGLQRELLIRVKYIVEGELVFFILRIPELNNSDYSEWQKEQSKLIFIHRLETYVNKQILSDANVG